MYLLLSLHEYSGHLSCSAALLRFWWFFSVLGRLFLKLLFHSFPSPCLHPDNPTLRALMSLVGVKNRHRAQGKNSWTEKDQRKVLA